MFVPAMTLSLMLVVASVHRYNERKTSSILTVLLTLPYTVTTIVTRMLAIAIIFSVFPVFWSTVLTAGLALALLVLNLACVQPREEEECEVKKMKQAEVEVEEDEERSRCSLCSCLVFKLPSLFLKSLASIVSPLGYNSDR